MKRAESSKQLAQCFKHSADNKGENEIINGSLQTQPDFIFFSSSLSENPIGSSGIIRVGLFRAQNSLSVKPRIKINKALNLV